MNEQIQMKNIGENPTPAPLKEEIIVNDFHMTRHVHVGDSYMGSMMTSRDSLTNNTMMNHSYP